MPLVSQNDPSRVNAAKFYQYLWDTCDFGIGLLPLGFNSHVSGTLLQFEFLTSLPI